MTAPFIEADVAVSTTPPTLPDQSDQVLLGVAGLIADALVVDALWVRIGFVLLGLASGVGIVLYLSLWLALIGPRSIDAAWIRYLSGAIVAAGVPLMIATVTFGLPLVVLALLIALAVVLWQQVCRRKRLRRAMESIDCWGCGQVYDQLGQFLATLEGSAVKVRRVGVGAVALVALTACGGGGDGGNSDATASPLADLMGWSDFDPVESRRQELAVEEAVVACMREEGFEYQPQDFSSQVDSGGGEEDSALMQDSPEAYGEKYGYGVVRNYELYEEPNIGEDGGFSGPTFVDPNEDYVTSLSDSERDAYYEVLYGPPQEEQNYDETDSEGTQAYYSPPLEEQGCQGKARLEVVGEDPSNDPEIQQALDDVFSAQQDDARLKEAQREWLDCMGDTLADYDLPDGMSVERAESMYEVINVLKAVAMGQEILPLDPETGEPIGDYDDSQGYSSSQNEDGTGFAYVGEQRIIPEDALERLRAEELALWRQDWDCQNEADIQKLRLQAEQDAVDDLVARFPQLGDSG